MREEADFKVSEQVVMIPIGRLLDNPLNRYMRGDVLTEESVAELTISVREKGVETPLLVTPFRDGFRIVCGHRRRLSSKLAGLIELPCIIREGLSEEEQFTLMMNENIQRKSLSLLAEASCYQKVVSEGKNPADIERDTGVGRVRISQLLSVLKLPKGAQGYFDEGRLPIGAVPWLAKISNEDELVRLARNAANGGWTVKAISQRVEARLAADGGSADAPRPRRLLRSYRLVNGEGKRLTKGEALAKFDEDEAFSLREIKRAILSSCCNECDEQRFPDICSECPVSQMLACLLRAKGAMEERIPEAAKGVGAVDSVTAVGVN